jgi:hypothetical protein
MQSAVIDDLSRDFPILDRDQLEIVQRSCDGRRVWRIIGLRHNGRLVRSRVVLFGGDPGNGNALGDTWSWDGSNWTQTSNFGANPRMRAAMVSTDVQIAMFGGLDSTNPALAPTAFREIWVFDGKRWTHHQDMGPSLQNGAPDGQYPAFPPTIAREIFSSRSVDAGDPSAPSCRSHTQLEPFEHHRTRATQLDRSQTFDQWLATRKDQSHTPGDPIRQPLRFNHRERTIVQPLKTEIVNGRYENHCRRRCRDGADDHVRCESGR